jgi:ribose transport system permease protein
MTGLQGWMNRRHSVQGADIRAQVVPTVQQYGIVITFALVFVALAVSQDAFFTWGNLSNVVYQNAPLAIIVVAVTIPMVGAGFDLSVGAIYASAGVTAAALAVELNPTAGILLGILLGLVLGILNGALITSLGIHSFLATLATGIIIGAVAVLYTGGFVVQVDDPDFRTLGLGTFLGLENAIWAFIGFAIIMGIVLSRSKFGRHVYAVGGNVEAARLSGIRISAIRIGTFAISGLGAGLAGVIGASRIGQGQTDVGVGLELTAIAAVVVGGTSIYGGAGAVWRSVFGVGLLVMIINGFNLMGIEPAWSTIITGAIIILAIALNELGRRR